MPLVQILIVANGQMLKINIAVWSHWLEGNFVAEPEEEECSFALVRLIAILFRAETADSGTVRLETICQMSIKVAKK